MIQSAALHLAARPLMVAALAVAGIAGPGIAAAHAVTSAPAPVVRTAECSPSARTAMRTAGAVSCRVQEREGAMHSAGMHAAMNATAGR